MLAAENNPATVASDLTLLQDELMIPLHLAFDLGATEEAMEAGALVAMLGAKLFEWGIGEAAHNALVAAIGAQLGASVSWGALVGLIEQMAMGE